MKKRGILLRILSLTLACMISLGATGITAFASEETATIFVAIGCVPGYEGSAYVTLTEVNTGEVYHATVGQENGWGVDVPVVPGTYKAEAEAVGGAEDDVCWIDENERTVEAGKVNSFAGVVGNEWDVLDRSSIIQLDAIGEDGRQKYYGELEEEDVTKAIYEMRYAAEHGGDEHEGDEEGGEGNYITPESDPNAGKEDPETQEPDKPEEPLEEKPEIDFVRVFIAVVAVIAIGATVVSIFVKRR